MEVQKPRATLPVSSSEAENLTPLQGQADTAAMQARKVPHSTRPLNRPTPVVQTVILMKLFPDTLEAMPPVIAAAAAAHLDQLTSSMTKANNRLQDTTPNTLHKDRPTRLRPVETLDTVNSSQEALLMVASPRTAAATVSRSLVLHTSTSAPTCQHRRGR